MKILAYLAVFLLIGVGQAPHALAGEIIRECPQADGTMLYINRAKLGCVDLILPQVSIAPMRAYHLSPDAPLVIPHEAMSMPTSAASSPQVCELYHKWIALQSRTFGGFQHNSVEDTQARLLYTTLFGSGYPPAGC